MAVSAADTTSKTEAASAAAAASPAIAPTSSAPAKPAGASTPHTDHALHGRALALVFFGLLLAMFISSLSETIAATALPTIVGDLGGVDHHAVGHHRLHPGVDHHHAHLRQAGRPVSAASVCSWSALSRLYTVGSAVCGLATNMDAAHRGPRRRGAWAAAASSSCRRPPSPTSSRRASAARTWASSAPCSPCRPCVGPLLGGWFVQVTGWRWLFCVQRCPLALLAMVVLGRRRSASRSPCAARTARLSTWRGMMAMAVAVTSLVLATGLGRHAIPWDSRARSSGLVRAGCGCRCGVRAGGAARERAHHPHGAVHATATSCCAPVTGLLLIMLGLMGTCRLPAHVLPDRGRPVARGRPASCARCP